MMDWFEGLHPVVQALVAGGGTWLVTAAGASAVFFTKEMSQRLLDAMLGFAAGAMFYVVVEELIPESHYHEYEDVATMGTLIGFTVMMVLDVALG